MAEYGTNKWVWKNTQRSFLPYYCQGCGLPVFDSWGVNRSCSLIFVSEVGDTSQIWKSVASMWIQGMVRWFPQQPIPIGQSVQTNSKWRKQQWLNSHAYPTQNPLHSTEEPKHFELVNELRNKKVLLDEALYWFYCYFSSGYFYISLRHSGKAALHFPLEICSHMWSLPSAWCSSLHRALCVACHR